MEIGYTLAKTGLLATSSPSPGARRRRASSTRSSPTTSVPGSTSRGTALRLERDRRDRRGDRAAALWHRRCLPAHPDPPRHRRPAAVESMRLLWQGGELDAPRQALHGRPLPHQQRSGRPGRARNRDRTAAGSARSSPWSTHHSPRSPHPDADASGRNDPESLPRPGPAPAPPNVWLRRRR